MKGKIFFIQADKEFENVKSKNILKEIHIKKIVEIYKNRKEINNFSELVDFQEIKSMNFNLNISLYI